MIILTRFLEGISPSLARCFSGGGVKKHHVSVSLDRRAGVWMFKSPGILGK